MLKLKKFIKWTFILTLLAGILTAGIIFINITYYANTSKPVKSDTMIVLGCQIWDKSPSWSLEYRLNKALELYNQGYSNSIIVSGGQGSDEPVPESSVMKAWLVEHGIPSEIIIEESKSTSTFENLKFSKEIMDKNHHTSAIIVSNDFHIFRSLRLAGNLGIKASGAPAPTVPHLKFYYNTREILSVVKSLLMDR